MAFALDGSVHGSWASGSSFNVALTVSQASGRAVIIVATNGQTITSITDTAGWTWTLRATTNGLPGVGVNPIEEWTAPYNAAVTNTITINYGSAPTYADATAFGIGVGGAFDTDASLPATIGTNTQLSVNTGNANDFIYVGYRGDNASLGLGAGWTQIQDGNFVLVEYQIVAATQSGITGTHTTGSLNGGIMDAVKQATAATSRARPYSATPVLPFSFM